MRPGVVQEPVPAVGVDVQREVDGAEGQPGHARHPGQFQRVHHTGRRLHERNQGEVFRHVHAQPAQCAGVFGFGHHDAEQAGPRHCSGEQRGDFGVVPARTSRVHAHQPAHGARGARSQSRQCRGERCILGVRRDRVLQVDDDDAGTRGRGFHEPLGAVSGDKQGGDRLCHSPCAGRVARCREAACRCRHRKSPISGRLDSSGRAASTLGRWPWRYTMNVRR